MQQSFCCIAAPFVFVSHCNVHSFALQQWLCNQHFFSGFALLCSLFLFLCSMELACITAFFFTFQQVFLIHDATFCLIQEECCSTKPKRKHHNTKCCTAKWMGGLLQCKATVLVAAKVKASFCIMACFSFYVLSGACRFCIALHHSLFCL